MMAPTFLIERDRAVVTGSGGSNRIRTAVLQVLLNLCAFGQSIELAVHAPRIHYERGKLDLEPGFPEPVTQSFCSRYPNHKCWDQLNMFFGGAHSVAIQGDRFNGSGDPRRGGVVIAVG